MYNKLRQHDGLSLPKFSHCKLVFDRRQQYLCIDNGLHAMFSLLVSTLSKETYKENQKPRFRFIEMLFSIQ